MICIFTDYYKSLRQYNKDMMPIAWVAFSNNLLPTDIHAYTFNHYEQIRLEDGNIKFTIGRNAEGYMYVLNSEKKIYARLDPSVKYSANTNVCVSLFTNESAKPRILLFNGVGDFSHLPVVMGYNEAYAPDIKTGSYYVYKDNKWGNVSLAFCDLSTDAQTAIWRKKPNAPDKNRPIIWFEVPTKQENLPIYVNNDQALCRAYANSPNTYFVYHEVYGWSEVSIEIPFTEEENLAFIKDHNRIYKNAFSSIDMSGDVTGTTTITELTVKPPRLMKFDPQTSEASPYPSEALQYRVYHGLTAWLFNPYTGKQRDPRDIGSDVQGFLL